MDDEALPHYVLAEVRLAIDTAALLYPGHGRVTIDAVVLSELLERALECDGIEAERDVSHEARAETKAKRVRAALEEHKGQQSIATCETCGAPTDGECHYESPLPALCEAIDNLLDDL